MPVGECPGDMNPAWTPRKEIAYMTGGVRQWIGPGDGSGRRMHKEVLIIPS